MILNTDATETVENEKNGSITFLKSPDLSRRAMLKTTSGTIAGGVAAMTLPPGLAHAGDVPPTHSSVSAPAYKIYDYSKIPQRLHKYPASDRAKENTLGRMLLYK